jgi:hypothetical protein
VEANNGKTKETHRGLEIGNRKIEPIELGEVEISSSSYGINQIGSSNQNCSGGDYPGSTIQGNSSAGKILEHLKLIENRHLSYVKGQQQHLEVRLDESREEEESFKKAVQELELEIYSFISSENDNKEQE